MYGNIDVSLHLYDGDEIKTGNKPGSYTSLELGSVVIFLGKSKPEAAVLIQQIQDQLLALQTQLNDLI